MKLSKMTENSVPPVVGPVKGMAYFICGPPVITVYTNVLTAFVDHTKFFLAETEIDTLVSAVTETAGTCISMELCQVSRALMSVHI